MNRQRLASLVVLAATLLCGCAAQPTRQELARAAGPRDAMPAGVPVADGRARFREIFCAVVARRTASESGESGCGDRLWKLDDEPPPPGEALPEPDFAQQIYLVPGAFSECLGEEAAPFRNAADTLSAAGYRISTITVSGRSGSEHNAAQIAARLTDPAEREQGPVVLIGYSKGTNDILTFLVRHPEAAARVDTVVSVVGAIGGSPLVDTAEPVYDGLLDRVPYLRCSPGDGQVLASLRPATRREWLASNPLPHSVRYFSIAAFTTRSRISIGLVPTWRMLLKDDLRNDGQLLARDMLIPGGTLLGYLDADHWSAAMDVEDVHPILGSSGEASPFPRTALLETILLQVAEARRKSSCAGADARFRHCFCSGEPDN